MRSGANTAGSTAHPRNSGGGPTPGPPVLRRMGHDPLACRHLLALPLAAMLASCAALRPASHRAGLHPPAAAAVRNHVSPRAPALAGRPAQPAAIESVADAVLSRAGLRRDDANPRLSVHVTASQDAAASGPAGAHPGWAWIGGGSWGGSSVGIGVNFPVGGTAVYPSQRVDVLLRDLANAQVVFQSQASGSARTPRPCWRRRCATSRTCRLARGCCRCGAGWVLKPYARLSQVILVECRAPRCTRCLSTSS